MSECFVCGSMRQPGRRPRGFSRVVVPAGVALAVVIAATIGAGSRAQEAKPADKTQPPTAVRPQAEKAALEPLAESSSREVLRALMQLRGAIGREAQTGKARAGARAGQTALPERPGRKVTPPTLTPSELDRLVDHYLAATDPKVEPAPLTSDIEFVRRVYFDLAGAPPTPEQVVAFVNSTDKDKRDRLIDRLVDSPEFASNWARYWRDVIRFHATNPNPVQVRYDELERWLTEQFQKNRPWDEIATDLITATGRVDENGAVSFPLAHSARPVELAGEVSRIFMGVQIQCAQCHDHKTDSWKQIQFHEFAAFFSGDRVRRVVRAMPGQLPVFEVQSQGRPRYAMPDKDDPNKQTPVAPRFFLASAKSEPLPLNLEAPARHALAASYITGQDNPWFARAFVNRIWYALMGESFYDAVDDLGPERTAKAPEVIETLAAQWQRGGYDIRWLFRTITATKAYQRRARSTANPAGKTAFASNCPSRMRSDQIIDGLAQALGLPVDLRLTPTSATDAAARKSNAKKAADAAGLGATGKAKGQAKAVRLRGPRILFNALFGVDPSIPNDEVLGTIPQALFLMNGPLVQNRIQARPGTPLREILASSPNPRAALDAVYLRVLSRQPNAKEVETCLEYIAKVGRQEEAFEDIYWALINSTEFISRR